MISGSNLSIEDAVFFCDERLASVNVYNVVFAIYDYDTLYPDLYTIMKGSCKLCILQQSSVHHCKFTFVSKLDSVHFNIMLNRAISQLYYMRKLSTNQLVLL